MINKIKWAIIRAVVRYYQIKRLKAAHGSKGEDMNAIKWAYAENIVTVICASLCGYFLSPWCFLLLLNINYQRKKSRQSSAAKADHGIQ